MEIDVTLLTTTADCDSALSLATKEKARKMYSLPLN